MSLTRTLAVLRIVHGSAALLLLLEMLPLWKQWLQPEVLRLPYASWYPTLPRDALPVLLTWWILSALAFLAGWATRWTGSVLAVVLGYVLFLDQQFYSNHHLLLVVNVVYLVLANGGAEWSIDARRLSPKQRAATPARANPWAARLLQTQLTAVYLFAGLSKLNPTFLSGAVLAVYLPREGFLAWPEAWRTQEVLQPLAGATVLGELALAVGLWLRGLRRLAMIGGGMLHLSMFALLDRSQLLGILSFVLTCLSIYLLWLTPEPDADASQRPQTPSLHDHPAQQADQLRA